MSLDLVLLVNLQVVFSLSLLSLSLNAFSALIYFANDFFKGPVLVFVVLLIPLDVLFGDFLFSKECSHGLVVDQVLLLHSIVDTQAHSL